MQSYNLYLEKVIDKTIRLYRGITKEFDPKHDINKTDAPHGYSTWTDNPDLARQYAGKDGFVYYIDLPTSEMGDAAIDENPKSETYGDRALFFPNDKKAGLNNIKGNEYLVYTLHDLYNASMIKKFNRNGNI